MQPSVYSQKNIPSDLADKIFIDRRCQFVDRLKWDLFITPFGYELDEYDDEYSHYLIVHRNGDHLGSCRVRSTLYTTMVEDHFLESFPEVSNFLKMQKGKICELTRFCRAPDISAKDSKKMLANLAKLIDSYRDRYNVSGFLAVVFSQVARLLDTLGVRYLVLSKSQVANKDALLICITHAVDARQVSFEAPRDKDFRSCKHQILNCASVIKGNQRVKAIEPVCRDSQNGLIVHSDYPRNQFTSVI